MIGKPGAAEDQRRRFDGGVWRYHPVRDVWEPYADGTTNPWGIDWNDYGHAFVCNCVNPHLFQVIQGAHYEPWRGRKSSQYAYQRIDTIADHLHFVGLGNVRNGLGSEAEDSAGGGHAHCGTMIYLGGSFPDAYRNQLFTNNIHGRRINNDLLRRKGSGYVASHGADLMRSQDPWFMGVTLAYGPSGEVYVSDWSDTGECHSTRNTRKHTGRLYRITYLQTQTEPCQNVAELTNEQLVQLQQHDNDWWVRHARRLLQERSQSENMEVVHANLRRQFEQTKPTPKKLRSLWALHVSGGLSDQDLTELLDHADEHLRAWAITLLCEDRQPPPAALTRLTQLAAGGNSPLVRLSLASALQRLSPTDRWPIAEALAARREDADDPNLPLMLWYGVEPLIEDDLPRYVQLAASAAIPQVRINIARRVVSSSQADRGLQLLTTELADRQRSASHGDLITGMLAGLEGRRQVTMPAGWREAAVMLDRHSDVDIREQAARLALVFNDPQAVESLMLMAGKPSENAALRNRVIDALVARRIDGLGTKLLNLLPDPAVRGSVLRGLAAYQPAGAAAEIIRRYQAWSSADKQIAVSTLASRAAWADELLTAIAAGKIPAADLTAFDARQIAALENEAVFKRLTEIWGEVRQSPNDRAKQIAKLKSWLTAEMISQGDLARGAELFKQQCAKCHTFFGEGGKIGPDITGAQRTNIDYLLENIVDPSASVSKDYQMQIFQTIDGQVITGLIEMETENAVTIQTVDQRITVPVDEIEKRKLSPVSIMPNEMLSKLTDAEIRDLLAYLQK
jgi:putative heme-binding domain-containing protein